MKKVFLFFLALVGFCLFQKCTKEISLSPQFEPEYFIYGFMSNESEIIKITIGATQAINSSQEQYIKDISLSLYEKTAAGETSLITSDFLLINGVYQSLNPINGRIGNSYWIEASIAGETFTSLEEELKASVEIKDFEQTSFGSRVIFSDPGGETNFYLANFTSFEGQETYGHFEELSNDLLFDGNEKAFIETYSLEYNTEIEVSLNQMSAVSYRFYSNFFLQISENEGFDLDDGQPDPSQLFATPPANIKGNIYNVRTNKAILGNFAVFSTDRYSKSIISEN